MPSDGNTITEKVGRWKMLGSGFRPFLEEFPHLAPRHALLEKIIVDIEGLEVRQGALKADLQEVNRQRAELAKQGDETRNRLAASLQAEHGFKSERLLEFGIKPRRTRSRKKKEPAPKAEAEGKSGTVLA